MALSAISSLFQTCQHQTHFTGSFNITPCCSQRATNREAGVEKLLQERSGLVQSFWGVHPNRFLPLIMCYAIRNLNVGRHKCYLTDIIQRGQLIKPIISFGIYKLKSQGKTYHSLIRFWRFRLSFNRNLFLSLFYIFCETIYYKYFCDLWKWCVAYWIRSRSLQRFGNSIAKGWAGGSCQIHLVHHPLSKWKLFFTNTLSSI